MKFLLIAIAFCICLSSKAQIFVQSGLIEFEVRTNNHKIFGDGIWAEMIKDKFPQFSTAYYHFIFKDDKAVYRFDRNDDKMKMPFMQGNPEDNIWFTNFRDQTFTHQKFVFDDNYLMSDSLKHIEWKMVPNETREIAGFNCRKAQAILFDSVYVFAFYTDEIMVSGGPMSLGGLPGMIMGVTIPRMHTSWIASKLQLSGFDETKIVAPKKGKKKPANELAETLKKVTADWGSWGQQSIWNIFL